jgi:hypothetical protein
VPAVLRQALAAVSLLLLTIYPYLALQVYTPAWYSLGCQYHLGCAVLGEARTAQGITEITRFWRHQGELGTLWSSKEKQHLREVRRIYDTLLVVCLLALAVLALTYERRSLPRLALINALVLLPSIAIFPFFKTFWVEVFHPLLFDNDLWDNTPADLSYFLMPRRFFLVSAATLVACVLLTNLVVWLGLRRPPRV